MNLSRADLEEVKTADGTSCLRHRRLGVLYRSSGGARTESEEIFIQGTQIIEKKEIWRILELGFGGACNFITLAEKAAVSGIHLDYRSVDHAPVPPDLLPDGSTGGALAKDVLRQCRMTGKPARMKSENLSIELYPMHWSGVKIEEFRADAVFFDPFAPDVNPDCWTAECFRWVKEHMTENAILATYCAQGKMRRAMAESGFFVARGPGSGGKRESTLASLSKERLSEFPLKYRP